MISDAAGEAVDLETTPEEVYWEKPDAGLLVHANHFRTDAARARVVDTGLAISPDSIYRDSRVERCLRQSAGRVARADFEAAFADTYGSPSAVLSSPEPDPSRDREPSSTVATIIMDTTAGAMWIAPAPYQGEIRFTEYRLDG
jgi:isopenicillin-N N-acyltransferase-like protein